MTATSTSSTSTICSRPRPLLRGEDRTEDLIAGPEAEALKVARTKRLIALNIVDTTVDWAELKDYIKVTLGRAPTFVKINHGVDKNWAIVEFSTLADARLAIDTLNGRPFRLGAPLYLRQDREDRSLNAACGGCCAPRNNSCVGEWFGMDWYCTRCTIPEDLHSLPVIDCHAHLDFVMDGRTGDEISDSEIRTAVFDDLALQGRFAVITSCCDLAAIENTIRLVRLGAGHVFAAFGAHPKRALHEWDADLKWLFKDAIRRCNRDPATGSYVRRVVAWGECGLDYSGYVGGDAGEEPAVGGAAGLTTQSDGALVKKSINLQYEYQQISNKSIALLAPVEVFDANQIRMEIARQKEILRENIDVAIELRLPIQFHSRDCEADFIDCLLQWLPRDHPFHWHSAIASLPAVEKILRHFPHGYFGVSGYLCFPYAEEWELPNQMQSETNHGNPMPTPNTVNLFDMVRRIPLERIVLETDSPHFTVRSGGPADVLEIAQALAEVKGGGLSAEKVLDVVEENVYRLYGIRAKTIDRACSSLSAAGGRMGIGIGRAPDSTDATRWERTRRPGAFANRITFNGIRTWKQTRTKADTDWRKVADSSSMWAGGGGNFATEAATANDDAKNQRQVLPSSACQSQKNCENDTTSTPRDWHSSSCAPSSTSTTTAAGSDFDTEVVRSGQDATQLPKMSRTSLHTNSPDSGTACDDRATNAESKSTNMTKTRRGASAGIGCSLELFPATAEDGAPTPFALKTMNPFTMKSSPFALKSISRPTC